MHESHGWKQASKRASAADRARSEKLVSALFGWQSHRYARQEFPSGTERILGDDVADDAVTTWLRTKGEAVRTWWGQGTNGSGERPGGRIPQPRDSGDPNRPLGPSHLNTLLDPWPTLMTWGGFDRHEMLFGAAGDLYTFTQRDSHLLILGPPRENKTAGVLIPLVLGATGPVVSSSTRDDVLRACATTRSRLGRVWHWNLNFADDATEPATAPGATPLRWSPLSKSYPQNRRVALAMIETAESAQDDETSRGSSYFKAQAARLVAPTLMAAALSGRGMAWATKIFLSQDPSLYVAVQEVLSQYRDQPGVTNATDSLDGILNMPSSHGSAADIFASAARAFEVFNDPAVIAATEPANFDPAAFVAGLPNEVNPDRFRQLDQEMSGYAEQIPTIKAQLPRGVYDTIFIEADADTATQFAPLIVGLLSALHRAARVQTQADQAAGIENRAPMTWALDEVASMAPWPKFPEVLSTSAGSNVLVAAVFHDLSQAEAKWNKRAKAIQTLMKTKLVFPGIENDETIKAIADSFGGHWVTTTSETVQDGYSSQGGWLTGTGGKNTSSGQTTSQTWLPILDAGIVKGGNPNAPGAVLLIANVIPGGHGWVYPLPYYSAPVIPELIVGSLMHLHQTHHDTDTRTQLPVPILDRDDGSALYTQWRAPEQAKYLVDWLRFYRQWQREVPLAPAPEAPQVVDAPVGLEDPGMVDDLYDDESPS